MRNGLLRLILILLLSIAVLCIIPACNEPSLSSGGHPVMITPTPAQVQSNMQGDLRAHDPALIKQGNTYYVFSTGGGIQIRSSVDLRSWQFVGTVFDAIPTWVTDAVGPLTDLWAPDISYIHGTYVLFYAGSQFGKNTSVIGLATNTTLDPTSSHYRWVDQGLVLQSTSSNDYNAIDPNLVLDAQQRPWLDFGSFWTGIKLRLLDPHTLKPSTLDTTLYALAANPGSDAIEAPSIVHKDGYYYLFASIDYCCRGADSTYKTVVGRARDITGPYVDRDGVQMEQGGFTLLLEGYLNMRGPGGASVYLDNGTYLLIHHYYDAAEDGAIKFFIRRLNWDKDGWPQAGAPVTGEQQGT